MGEKCCQSKKSLNESENTQAVKKVVYLNADTMGRDDDGLGAVLMTAFLESLNHSVNEFSHILMVNSAVKLVCESSPVLNHMKEFADFGIELLSCGTCLKHYNLMDKLQAGEVSNMVTILEIMKDSQKVVAP